MGEEADGLVFSSYFCVYYYILFFIMDLEEFLKRRRDLKKRSDDLFARVASLDAEESRTIHVLNHAEQILDDLDAEFERRTGLSKVDWGFLWLATALQLVRIYLLPKFQEKYSEEKRMKDDDPSIGKMESAEREKFQKKHQNWDRVVSHKEFRDWHEILFDKVPYDATKGCRENNRTMHGKFHRVKTLGHDPVLGWVFGVCNIISDTITVVPELDCGEKKIMLPLLESYSVDMGPAFCWKDPVTNASVFSDTQLSVGEDKHRLYAAVFAHGLHLASDKFTKVGLPVPFLSTIDSDEAYRMYQCGYDLLELEYQMQLVKRTLKSAGQSLMINRIIGAMHTFFYNPKVDTNPKLYSVRTRKILLYSNVIATSSDVVQTAVRSANGDEHALDNFDLGGFLVTLHRLMVDPYYIRQVKEEFVYKEWDRIVDSPDNILNI